MPLPVTCPACGKSFSIADDVFEQKIKGRVVTVKCKQCQAPIRVDGTRGLADATVTSGAAAPVPVAPTAPVASAVTPESPTPAAATRSEPRVAEPPAPAPVAAAVAPAEAAAVAEPSAPAAAAFSPAEAPTPPSAATREEPSKSPAAEVKPDATPEPPTPTPAVDETATAPAEVATKAESPVTPAAPATENAPIANAPVGAFKTPGFGAKPATGLSPRPLASKLKASEPKVADAKIAEVKARAAFASAPDESQTLSELTEAKTADLKIPGKVLERSAEAKPLEAKLPEAKSEPKRVEPRVPEAKPVSKLGLRGPVEAKGGFGKAPLASAPRAALGSNPDLTGAAAASKLAEPSPAAPAVVAKVPEPAPAALQTTPAAPPAHDIDAAFAEDDAPSDQVLFAVDTPGGDRELTEKQIADELSSGTLTPDTLVWRDGMDGWLPIAQVTELSRHIKKKAAPKPAVQPKTGGFRSTQATIPMGVLPNVLGKQAPGPPLSPGKVPATLSPDAPTPAPPGRSSSPPAAASALAEAREQASQKTPIVGLVMSDEEPTVMRVAPLGDLQALRAAAAAAISGNATAPAAAPAAVEAPPAEVPVVEEEDETRVAFNAKDLVPAVTTAKTPLPEGRPKVEFDTFRATPEAKKNWFPEEVPEPKRSQPSSPFPVGSALPFASSPEHPAIGSAPSLGAPVVAKSAPYAAPAGAPSGPLSSRSADEVAALRPKSSRTLLFVVLLLLIAGTAAAVFFFTQNKRSAAVPSVPTPVPLAPEAPTASEAATATAPASEAPSTTAVGQAPPADGTAAPAGSDAKAGGFADLFANGAKQANTDTTATFDANAAKAALDARLGIAARCREVGGPLGITRVNVTFALDGTVSSATISDAPFAGTTVGACICEAFKKARVKPFSGLPGQVSQRISIQ